MRDERVGGGGRKEGRGELYNIACPDSHTAT